MPMLKLTSEDQHFIRSVLSPSWLSGLFMILAALVVTGGAIITFSLNHSAFKQDLIGWEQSHTNTLSITGQSTQSVNPTLANSWPLIIVWAAVGLLTYTLAVSIIHSILEAIELRRELDYVHADRRSMLEVTIEHLVTRLVSAVFLLILVLLFVYHLLPYAISSAQASASHFPSASGIRDAAISFFLTALCAYLATIFLRLCIGKARILSR